MTKEISYRARASEGNIPLPEATLFWSMDGFLFLRCLNAFSDRDADIHSQKIYSEPWLLLEWGRDKINKQKVEERKCSPSWQVSSWVPPSCQFTRLLSSFINVFITSHAKAPKGTWMLAKAYLFPIPSILDGEWVQILGYTALTDTNSFLMLESSTFDLDSLKLDKERLLCTFFSIQK